MRTICCLLTATLTVWCSASAHAADGKPLQVFFLTQSAGFQHSVVKRPAQDKLSLAEEMVTAIGKESGVFETRCSKDATLITPELLKNTDVMMFYSTGSILGKNEPVTAKTPETEWVAAKETLGITKDNWDAFDAWLKSGKAMVGIHSASDTGANFTPYQQLINGSFAGHPWGSGTTVTFTNHEPTHPTMSMWDPEFTIKEEIYQYKGYEPKSVRVLMSINMEKTELKRPRMIPVAWVRDYGAGRLFYTNLGHNESTWNDTRFKKHLLEGVKWATKITDGPATPNPELQTKLEKEARAVGFIAGVKQLAALSGKDEAALLAAWTKKATGDDGKADKMYAAVEAQLGSKEKDKDKRKADAEKVANDILAVNVEAAP